MMEGTLQDPARAAVPRFAIPPPIVRPGLLWLYFLFTYGNALFNTLGYLREIKYAGALTPIFAGAVYLSYSAIYLLPVLVPMLLLNRVLSWRGLDGLFKPLPLAREWLVYLFAVIGFTLIQILIFADLFVYRMFGFHLNGFVWNVLSTPGGMEAMGAGTSTVLSFTLIGLGFLLIQSLLLLLALRVKRVRRFGENFFTSRVILRMSLALALLVVAQALIYGVGSLRNHSAVLTAASGFPLYQPVTFSSAGRALGIKTGREPDFKLKVESIKLRYPLKPIEQTAGHKNWNVVWLVAESLRADMLSPEVMPAASAFAARSTNFRQHYSGGNGTRMGMFSMFYGLYGSYWFPFLAEQRGPVLLDTLLANGYQMEMFTSAEFTYPEFDKTIFARIPPEHLHTCRDGMGWERDRANVGRLIESMEKRDPARPFMRFMFFESPHAPYHFPKETIIREPYQEDMNYAKLLRKPDMALIKNRYINSCRHLDTQLERVLGYLRSSGLLDSTIVIITGDHGEEFMEKGRWGHGSDYSDAQTRTPLVIWAPGRAPEEVTRMTSHLDLPATVLAQLGVCNPPGDYSLGHDLFSDTAREYCVLADWNRLCYMDQQYKAVIPLNGWEIAQQSVSAKDDSEVADKAPFYETRRARLLQVMKELSKFSNKMAAQ